MMKLLLVWLINAAALFALPYLFKSIQIDSFTTALIVALILSIVNTIIRPILFLLTLPITVLTLGLFIFVLNGLMLWMVASFVKGFAVSGFWPAVFGAIVYSLISWAATSFILGGKKS
jgi:putative membrane protein